MSYGLDEFIVDCRAAIDVEGEGKDLERIRCCAEKIADNRTFVDTYFGTDAKVGSHILHQDPGKGFMILTHIKDTGFDSPPHDHGASWAVYCQIEKYVDMCEYDRQDDGAMEGKADLVHTNSYRLNPGQAGFFMPLKFTQFRCRTSRDSCELQVPICRDWQPLFLIWMPRLFLLLRRMIVVSRRVVDDW